MAEVNKLIEILGERSLFCQASPKLHPYQEASLTFYKSSFSLTSSFSLITEPVLGGGVHVKSVRNALQVDPSVQKLYDYIRERGTIISIKVGLFTLYHLQSLLNFLYVSCMLFLCFIHGILHIMNEAMRNLRTLQDYDKLLLKTGDVSRYVQQSIRNGSDEWESLVSLA